jgi:23S rRNA pseudouridine2605 synthase
MLKKEKLQKIVARLGFGSRREVEEWIKQGRLKVNQQVAKLGDRASTYDQIQLNGRLLRLNDRLKTDLDDVLIYHKPAGELCTRRDPEGRPTVFDHLPKMRSKRWVGVGRLDFNTSGLLLFTTNGELADRLMHPSFEIEREYAVRILGTISDEGVERLKRGVKLSDGMARVDDIRDAGGEGANHWYHVVVREGRNREIRRLFESQNVKVSRLIRVRYGFITLPRFLRAGRSIKMTPAEVSKLLQLVDLKSVVPETRSKQPLKSLQPTKSSRSRKSSIKSEKTVEKTVRKTLGKRIRPQSNSRRRTVR